MKEIDTNIGCGLGCLGIFFAIFGLAAFLCGVFFLLSVLVP